MKRHSLGIRRLGVLLTGLAPVGLTAFGLVEATVAQEPPGVDPAAALTEGHRLFQEGQIEASIEVYLSAYPASAPHSTLAYNLGAAYHHLGRLPEAVLWYRRAGDSGDPWLEENLWLARRSLESRILKPGGPLGVLAHHARLVRWIAVGLAWAALAVTVARRRRSIQVVGATFVICVSIYAMTLAAERWGPQPAVIVAACHTSDGDPKAVGLPAGTEVWVRSQADGTFSVAGSTVVCPADAVRALT